MKILFVDTETDSENKNVVEIGWVLAEPDYGYAPLCTGQVLLRGIPHPITEINPNLTGILLDDTILKYVEVFTQCLSDCDIIVAHNIKFDIGKLSKMINIPNKPQFCTCYNVDWKKMGCEKKSMEYLCNFFNVIRTHAHTALDDVQAMINLVKSIDDSYFLNPCRQIVEHSIKTKELATQKIIQSSVKQEVQREKIESTKESTLNTYSFVVQDVSLIPEKYITKDERGQNIVRFENITKETLYQIQERLSALRFPNARLI